MVAEAVLLEVKVDGVDSQPGCVTLAELAHQDTWVTATVMPLRAVGSDWQWDGNLLEQPLTIRVPGSLVQCLNPKLLLLRDEERPSSSASGPPAQHVGYILRGPDLAATFEQLVLAWEASNQSLYEILGVSSSILPYQDRERQAAFVSPAGVVDESSAAAAGLPMDARTKITCNVRCCGRTVKVCSSAPTSVIRTAGQDIEEDARTRLR